MMPRAIIAKILQCEPGDIYDDADYQAIIRHILSWRKLQANWDEYRNKIDPILLEKLTRILQDCRREGFVFGRVSSEEAVLKIIWMQRVAYVEPGI
jgi:DNA polymerase I-like protein with 3'-5' exonuclease and polymerase domains